MIEPIPFQYVVLRCVPRVDREEFINVGVVLYAQAADYLNCAGYLTEPRLLALAPDLDIASVQAALDAVCAICRGDRLAGEAGQAGLGQRFGWLAAPKSTVLQPGPIHGGLTADPDIELARLVDMLVR
ncbi:MAG: DUF3037 domain-containing protein [Jatrophihabitantaceae bacterium]